MSVFDRALELVLGHEGGFADDPDDPGGATMRGVTQATYDRFRDRKDLPRRHVREIDDWEVRAIYRDYWEGAHCDALPPAVAVAHFDMAINAGPRQAVKTLQRAVGVDVDGIFGPVTLAATEDRADLLDDYLFARLDFYVDLAVARPRLRKFLPSWVRRCLHLRTVLRRSS